MFLRVREYVRHHPCPVGCRPDARGSSVKPARRTPREALSRLGGEVLYRPSTSRSTGGHRTAITPQFCLTAKLL